MRVATFRLDVTPPIGAPLCGGLVAPVRAVADPLYAVGVVLLSGDEPIVLCAVDWCEINNTACHRWRAALAAAVGTSANRVALHTVHQHDAPIADPVADAVVREAGLGPFTDVGHFEDCVRRSAEAARASLRDARPVSHVAAGSATVLEVASARRIVGADGKVRLSRWSATRDPVLRTEPEGLIDPHLRTITLLDGDHPLVSLHYYATHPMSYYGDGVVSSDFAGLARDRRRARTPGCEHLYFNGCAGDITPGKYNEGTPESRARLTDRIHAAMAESERRALSSEPQPIREPVWKAASVRLPTRSDLDLGAWLAVVQDPRRSESDRRMAAQRAAYLRRAAEGEMVSCLGLGPAVRILHLPGEPFVNYQLGVSRRAPCVAVAGYGDTGAGYLPLARSFAEGGYEPEASSVSPAVEPCLRAAMESLL